MPSIDDQMKLAVDIVRSGDKERASAMFLSIVDIEPENVHAWLWLSELTDSLEEQTAMIEQAMKFIPTGQDGEKNVQAYINEMHASLALPVGSNSSHTAGDAAAHVVSVENQNSAEIIQQAERLTILGKRHKAFKLVRELTEAGQVDEHVWMMYSELSAKLPEKVRGLEKALEINQDNTIAISRVERLKQLQGDPFRAGRYFEECGEMEQALGIYREIAYRDPSRAKQAKARKYIAQIAATQTYPGQIPLSGGSRNGNILKKILSFFQKH